MYAIAIPATERVSLVIICPFQLRFLNALGKTPKLRWKSDFKSRSAVSFSIQVFFYNSVIVLSAFAQKIANKADD